MVQESINDVNTLLQKVDEFDKTISELVANLKKFKSKLLDKKKKYGPDISKWPSST